jgi:putative DNA primase/helicase
MADDGDMPGAHTVEITPDDAEIARLAGLPGLQYDREREAAARELGCRVSTLDAAVRAARPKDGTGAAVGGSGQGRSLDLHEPEPWPEAVGGAELLYELTATIRRHVVLGETEAIAVALWVLAAHAFDAFFIFPRLFVTAPEKGCGKSTLLDVIGSLVPRKLSTDNITAAALFRTVEAARPTLLLDEADTYMRDREDLRGIIDSGHRRDGGVIRTVGDDHEPRRFSTWAPVVLAAIGRLPGTIEDRSIKIGLRRRRPDEPLEPLRLDRTGGLEELARKAARWAADHTAELAICDPPVPAAIVNRTADNWRPLLAVADLAGETWPERARKVVIGLSADSQDGESAAVLLLGDLRELFSHEPSGVLFTREILVELHKDETRPWSEWKHGKPITDRQLAAQLKPHKIRPKTVRRGNTTEKGYMLAWFEDTFARYLPARSVTASQVRDSAAFEPTRSVTMTDGVTDENLEEPCISARCDGVTDRSPLWWSDGDQEWPGRDPEEAVWTE